MAWRLASRHILMKPKLAMPAFVSSERLILAAFVCLLVVAAGLRFYDLPGNSIWYDEAVVANNSRGSLSEVVTNTRHSNTSPILYPLALWAVQKVDVSAFSVRVLPATASVLTVAVMLFLLPRLGVARGAAFLAALMATLSTAAIYHAQDAREYSIDALLATLMTAGLLWYLRDGRKALLCASLFLAPLIQYGLVLFGVAVMGAAVILSSPTLSAPKGNSIRSWIESRIALLLPAACFLAGCAISYLVTLPYQFGVGGYEGYYYQGAYDTAGVLGFAASRTRSILNYHLPQDAAIPIYMLVAGIFALMLAASLKRRRLDAIAILALFAVGIAIFASALALYPLGGIRQNIYLGPVIFLAAGVAIHWMADSLGALLRRAWLAPALVVAAAGAIALAGVGDMWRDSPYETDHNAKAVLAFLEENVEEGDVVFATGYTTHSMKFYQDEKPSGYHYGKACWITFEECLREMVRLVLSLPNAPDRIFVVHGGERTHVGGSVLEVFEMLGEQTRVERVIADGEINISLIVNAKEAIEPVYETLVSDYEAIVSGEPIIRADFDVYLHENTLTYVKEPCAPAYTEATFFLALFPVDVNDLPDQRKQHGFDNLDFRFDWRGVILGGRCIVTAALPEYDIIRIRTGQYGPVDGGYDHIWEGEFVLDKALLSAYESAASNEPVIRSDFDVYLSENTLTYVREPCARADVEATFFLALFPVDVNDLTDHRKQYGFDNLDFRFDWRGVILDGRCMAAVALPEYDIARIRTGQYVPVDGGYDHIWEGEIRLDQ